MQTLLIVYHTMTGGTLQMAQAAARGATQAEPDIQISLKHAVQATTEDVLAANAYVFATPENLAAMSGLMKDFFDRTYYGALERLNGRPYAVLVCAGNDGTNAAQQIERVATGWRLKAIARPLIIRTHASTPDEIRQAKEIAPEALGDCEVLGATLAAGMAFGIY